MTSDTCHHDWPVNRAAWEEVARCHACGLRTLRVLLCSADWVVRRVEHMRFLDDRTVRRCVSVDHATPAAAVTFRLEGRPPLRVVPLAQMRRKSLVNFDLRDAGGRSLSLLGLRETQALTLSIVRGWAAATLQDQLLDEEVDNVLEAVVAGDQRDMEVAYDLLGRSGSSQLVTLRGDLPFMTVLDRFADNFLLYFLSATEPGIRSVVKFSYDEPLTLRYSEPGYRGPHKDRAGLAVPPHYTHGEPVRGWRRRAPVLAALGLAPTLIRFPIPAAEAATSYHVEIDAPPEVSIVDAGVLAGRPNEHQFDRPRPRPSFDRLGGGFPTVDLHVTDVPLGALSRAQVSLQASTRGWLPTAALSCWLATVTLTVAWHYSDVQRNDVGSSLLVGFTAGVVALLARPDPHRMVTRLISGVRNLAMLSAFLSFAGAILFTFVEGPEQRLVLFVLAAVSLLPSLVVTTSWALALVRLHRGISESLWEQRRPPSRVHRTHPMTDVITDVEAAPRPYDCAVRALGFDRCAVRVASSEGMRETFPWDDGFELVLFSRAGLSSPQPGRLRKGWAAADGRAPTFIR